MHFGVASAVMSIEWPDPNDQSCPMKTVGISEARRDLCALINGLASGSPVLIVDRGRPVARLEPLGAGPGEDDGRLARLVQAGMVHRSVSRLPRSMFSSFPPRPTADSSAVADLIEEHRKRG